MFAWDWRDQAAAEDRHRDKEAALLAAAPHEPNGFWLRQRADTLDHMRKLWLEIQAHMLPCFLLVVLLVPFLASCQPPKKVAVVPIAVVPVIPAIRAPLMVVSVLYVALVNEDSVPAQYRGWYADAERCSGLRGEYESVKWFTTPHPWGDTTWAMWQPPHRITINREDALDSAIVFHEALHDILSYQRLYQQNEAHPSSWYGPGRCSSRSYHHN